MRLITLFICILLCEVVQTSAQYISSPDGQIQLSFSTTDLGQPQYSILYKSKTIIKDSKLGFEVKDKNGFDYGMEIVSSNYSFHGTIWHPIWGENDSIRDNYNELIISLRNNTFHTLLNIRFRVYNDGVGFRYEFPKQTVKKLIITDELTEFAMISDMTAWWIPGDYDTQEYEYTKSRLSEIRMFDNGHMQNVAQSRFSPTGVQTSLMLKTDDGIYINIHEAALVDFPAIHLNLDDTNYVFTSWLTPNINNDKAEIEIPFSTPWRAVMISDKATDILASNLILNLNEPCKITDTSWIKPIKYMGVWWEMITGKSTWSYCDAENFDLASFDYTKAIPHGRHGANNKNVKHYIDFAAENGFEQLLVEGWNIGWEDWFGK